MKALNVLLFGFALSLSACGNDMTLATKGDVEKGVSKTSAENLCVTENIYLSFTKFEDRNAFGTSEKDQAKRYGLELKSTRPKTYEEAEAFTRRIEAFKHTESVSFYDGVQQVSMGFVEFKEDLHDSSNSLGRIKKLIEYACNNPREVSLVQMNDLSNNQRARFDQVWACSNECGF